jgi:hypothetical protein
MSNAELVVIIRSVCVFCPARFSFFCYTASFDPVTQFKHDQVVPAESIDHY